MLENANLKEKIKYKEVNNSHQEEFENQRTDVRLSFKRNEYDIFLLIGYFIIKPTLVNHSREQMN